jgi:tetratricopeptide (TPR) repeat protein
MRGGKTEEALKLFKLLADYFPDSSTAYDSLGEVYLALKNTKPAINSFQRSLELDPDNNNAKRRLAELLKK